MKSFKLNNIKFHILEEKNTFYYDGMKFKEIEAKSFENIVVLSDDFCFISNHILFAIDSDFDDYYGKSTPTINRSFNLIGEHFFNEDKVSYNAFRFSNYKDNHNIIIHNYDSISFYKESEFSNCVLKFKKSNLLR